MNLAGRERLSERDAEVTSLFSCSNIDNCAQETQDCWTTTRDLHEEETCDTNELTADETERFGTMQSLRLLLGSWCILGLKRAPYMVVFSVLLLIFCGDAFPQNPNKSPFTGRDSADLARILGRANAFSKETPGKRDRIANIAWTLMAADAAAADDTQLFSLSTDLFDQAFEDWDALEKELKDNPEEAQKLLREDNDFALYMDLIQIRREEFKKSAELSRQQERARLDLLRSALVQYRDICNQLATAHAGMVFGDADAAAKSAEDAIRRYKALEATINEPRAFWLFDKEPIVASNRQEELQVVLKTPTPIFPNMEAHTGSVAALSLLTMADGAESDQRETLLRAAIKRAESSLSEATPKDTLLIALLTYVKAAANKRLIFDDIETALDDEDKRKGYRDALAELETSLRASLSAFEASKGDYGTVVTRCREDLRHILADASALDQVGEHISSQENSEAMDELLILAVFSDSPRVAAVLSFLASSSGQHQLKAQQYNQYLLQQALPEEAEQEVQVYSTWLDVAREVSKDKPDSTVLYRLSKDFNSASTAGTNRWLQCWATIGRSACDATLLASFQDSPFSDELKKTGNSRLKELRDATSELLVRSEAESSILNRQLMESQLVIGFAAEAAMAARFDDDYYDSSQTAATNSLRLSTRTLPQPNGLDLLGSALTAAFASHSSDANGELIEEQRILRFATNAVSQSMLALLVADPKTASDSIGETVESLNLVQSATAVAPREWYKTKGTLPRAQSDPITVRSDALAASAVIHAKAGKLSDAIRDLQAITGTSGDPGQAIAYATLPLSELTSPLESYAASYVGHSLLPQLPVSSKEHDNVLSVARQALAQCVRSLQSSRADAMKYSFLLTAATQLEKELNNAAHYTETANAKLARMQFEDAAALLQRGLLVFPDDDGLRSSLLKVELAAWRSGQTTNFSSSTRARVNATRESHGEAATTAFQLGQIAEAMGTTDKAMFWYDESIRLSGPETKEAVVAGARLAVINAVR